jgi:threonine synthase
VSGSGAPDPSSRWVCIVCGGERPLDDPAPWRCPAATSDDRHHVLHAELTRWSDAPASGWTDRGIDPFVANDGRLAWSAAAAARGVHRNERRALVERLDERLVATGSTAFAPTPLTRSTVLSDELGFAAGGGVWVKDETANVGGSHKARHLQSILLHLEAGAGGGAVLAIASCGNAAIAAAVLARAARRPLDVYVPTWAGAEVGELLRALGARITRCERRDSDPPGDPAMHRFREAVEAGAVPFTVQGPENALCLDGGRTLGWEVLDQAEVGGLAPFGRVFAQVGGGAFAADLGAALCPPGGPSRLHPVQAAGCAPLVRAWQRAGEAGIAPDALGAHWDELMTPWSDPASLADGILDDETYDWLDVCAATAHSGGRPVVATERHILDAHRLARRAGFRASPTGTAGLAGVLAVRAEIDPGERVLIVATGTER